MSANPINVSWTTGQTLYVYFKSNMPATVGQFFNFTSGALEPYNSANWNAYTPTILSENGSSGDYEGTPATSPNALPAGSWIVCVRQESVSGTRAYTDAPIPGGAGILNWTGTAEIFQGTADVDMEEMTTALPFSSPVFTAAALANAPGQTGSGPYAVTFTVTDSVTSSPIVGATVAAIIGTTTTCSGATNSSGQITLGLSAATYTFIASATAYEGYASTGNIITASGSRAFTMIAYPTPPPNPNAGMTNGYWYVAFLDTTITYQMITQPSGAGTEFSGALFTATSSSATPSTWEAPLFLGATYRFICNNGPALTFTVPSNAANPLALPNLISGD